MEKKGIIEEHTGQDPWVSDIVLAPKENDSVRVTVDMRRVDKAIKKTSLPIPRVEDTKAQLSSSKVYAELRPVHTIRF